MIVRYVVEHDLVFFQRALADEPLAQFNIFSRPILALRRIAGQQG